MRVRRAVLGDAHVDKALEATASTPEFQDFITRDSWGKGWTRPGLDVRYAAAARSRDDRRNGAMGRVPAARGTVSKTSRMV